MSEFDHIIMYLNVVETKSFTKAADRLGISANAVSKQVTQLEQELGLTLLSRSTRHLEVTEAGKIIYQKGKLAQRSLADINEYARSSQTKPSGTLAIAASMGTGQSILSAHLPEFLQLYPELSVYLQFSDEFPDLNSLENDSINIIFGFSLSLIPDKLKGIDLIRKRVSAVQRIICASPEYLARNGEPQNYDDLQTHSIIVHSHNPKNSLIRECEKRQIQLPGVILVNNSASILKLAIEGNGIANVADLMVNAELAAGTLKRILPFHQEHPIEIYLFYKKTRYLPLKIIKFIEFFIGVKLSG